MGQCLLLVKSISLKFYIMFYNVHLQNYMGNTRQSALLISRSDEMIFVHNSCNQLVRKGIFCLT